jgi:hypothetical protein
MTIIKRLGPKLFEDIVSGTLIEGRKRKIYRKDSDGYYYIPEVSPVETVTCIGGHKYSMRIK